MQEGITFWQVIFIDFTTLEISGLLTLPIPIFLGHHFLSNFIVFPSNCYSTHSLGHFSN